jgi:hypothetical protein
MSSVADSDAPLASSESRQEYVQGDWQSGISGARNQNLVFDGLLEPPQDIGRACGRISFHKDVALRVAALRKRKYRLISSGKWTADLDELVEAVAVGYGPECLAREFRTVPRLREHMAATFNAFDRWDEQMCADVARWYSFVAMRQASSHAPELLLLLPVTMSLNVIAYTWLDGGDFFSHVWVRSCVLIVDRTFPTVVLLRGRNNYDCWEPVDWAFGKPLRFFSFHRRFCPFQHGRSGLSNSWCTFDCVSCNAMHS